MAFPRKWRSVWLSDLVGRDVALLGVGREGLAAWRRLRALDPEQPLTLYSEGPVPDEVRAMFGDRDRLVTGPLDGGALGRHEVLVRSPGVSPYREPLIAAGLAGARITTGTNLWMAEHRRARTLCVTGTKGKSTTSALLAHLLEAAGQRVRLAGNIGVPLVACDPNDADWWVLELSSYQLCDLEERPWLGVLLNLSDEHLDWHQGAANYRRDKLRLAELAPEGRLVANREDPTLVSALAGRPDTVWFNDPGGVHVRDGGLWDGASPMPGLARLPGKHNLANLAAALTVLDLLGHRPRNLAAALETFQGLPHRLASLGERDGMRYVDDSLSTTPVATLAALQALEGEPVTVLVGGLDRGLDWAQHAVAFRAAAPHALVGLPDSGPAILDALRGAGLSPPGGVHLAADMPSAVRQAQRVTPPGGVVLLSPGAPSFPHYSDYAARAAAFRDAVFDDSREAGESEDAGLQG